MVQQRSRVRPKRGHGAGRDAAGSAASSRPAAVAAAAVASSAASDADAAVAGVRGGRGCRCGRPTADEDRRGRATDDRTHTRSLARAPSCTGHRHRRHRCCSCSTWSTGGPPPRSRLTGHRWRRGAAKEPARRRRGTRRSPACVACRPPAAHPSQRAPRPSARASAHAMMAITQRRRPIPPTVALKPSRPTRSRTRTQMATRRSPKLSPMTRTRRTTKMKMRTSRRVVRKRKERYQYPRLRSRALVARPRLSPACTRPGRLLAAAALSGAVRAAVLYRYRLLKTLRTTKRRMTSDRIDGAEQAVRNTRYSRVPRVRRPARVRDGDARPGRRRRRRRARTKRSISWRPMRISYVAMPMRLRRI